MFVVSGPRAGVATVGDLKSRLKETLDAAQDMPVYVVRDGKPVAGIVGMELMAVLEEALEDRRLAAVAGRRLNAIREGDDALIDEDTFWAAVEAKRAAPTEPKRRHPKRR